MAKDSESGSSWVLYSTALQVHTHSNPRISISQEHIQGIRQATCLNDGVEALLLDKRQRMDVWASSDSKDIPVDSCRTDVLSIFCTIDRNGSQSTWAIICCTPTAVGVNLTTIPARKHKWWRSEVGGARTRIPMKVWFGVGYGLPLLVFAAGIHARPFLPTPQHLRCR